MPALKQIFSSKSGQKYILVSGDDYVFKHKDHLDLTKIFNDPPICRYITCGALKKYYKNKVGVEILASDFLHSLAKNWQEMVLSIVRYKEFFFGTN